LFSGFVCLCLIPQSPFPQAPPFIFFPFLLIFIFAAFGATAKEKVGEKKRKEK